jgi:murein DD-endopeptidase MepM/ murein hydrolase activator NlpD
MNGPLRNRMLGIPWLGLPLGGVLAFTAALQISWNPWPFGRAEAASSAPVVGVSVETAGSSVPRLPDHAASLRPGETLGALLRDLGLQPQDAVAVAGASARHIDPRQLRAGTPWAAYLDDDGGLRRFELAVAGRGELAVERGGSGWLSSFREYRRESRTRAIRGELEGALEASVARAGAAPELAYLMADVLQWDLDFTRDLRRGDEFRVLFEEVLVEGHEPRPERVLAVEYVLAMGRRIEAYHFGDAGGGGYYDGEGRPLQKMFLRSPLGFSRITSRFSHRRFHPVLGVYRPHYGVDYGAPVGTPVRVTASGTVVSAGWDGGGGKTIKVRHPNGYLTAYLHLSRYAQGIRAGARVRQGEVIGFVGDTGLATAPHLDYRVQHHGRWIDPLSLRAVPAEPVDPSRRTEFQAVRAAMRASLETGTEFRPPALTLAREAGKVAAAGGNALGTSRR